MTNGCKIPTTYDRYPWFYPWLNPKRRVTGISYNRYVRSDTICVYVVNILCAYFLLFEVTKRLTVNHQFTV